MNRNDFNGFITDNKVPGESEISGVREMTTLFPWFHSAHLVLLKTLIENSDIKFETQLHKSALFIADRSILYNYLYQAPSSKSEADVPVEEPHLISTIEADKVQPEEQPSYSAAFIPTDNESSSEEETISSDTSTGKSVMPELEVVTRSREELIAEIEARLKDLTNATEILTAGIKDSEIVSIESDIEKTESTEATVEEVVTPVFDDTAISEEDPLMDIEYDNEGYDEAAEVQSISEKHVTGSADLLELDGEENRADCLVTEGETNVIGLSQPQQDTDEYVINISELKSESEAEEHKLTQADLIDKFIQTSPRLDRMTHGGEHPVVDLAEQSAKEEAPFITETIAKIYVNQGYYSKAINIYEKLTLQFPEKSAYFASRIEKIKDLIK